MYCKEPATCFKLSLLFTCRSCAPEGPLCWAGKSCVTGADFREDIRVVLEGLVLLFNGLLQRGACEEELLKPLFHFFRFVKLEECCLFIKDALFACRSSCLGPEREAMKLTLGVAVLALRLSFAHVAPAAIWWDGRKWRVKRLDPSRFCSSLSFSFAFSFFNFFRFPFPSSSFACYSLRWRCSVDTRDLVSGCWGLGRLRVVWFVSMVFAA